MRNDALRACLDAGSDDDEVIAALYRRYRPALVRFCRGRLPNPGDAEDAAHDTFVRAMQALPRLDVDAPVWPWLATIAANVCSDTNRRGRRRERLAAGLGVDRPEVDEEVTARLRASVVIEALDSLAPRHRVPIYLKDLVGWTYQEIARLQDNSVGAVRSSLMRSRRVLASRIESVARSRHQWPLPAAAPGVLDRARASWRHWRTHASRPDRPAVVALDPVLVTGVWTVGSRLAMLATAAAAAWSPVPGPVVDTPATSTALRPHAPATAAASIELRASTGAAAAAAPVPATIPSRDVVTVSAGAVLGADDGDDTGSTVTETWYGFTVHWGASVPDSEVAVGGSVWLTCGFEVPLWATPCGVVKELLPE